MAKRKSNLKFRMTLQCDKEVFIKEVINIIVHNLELPSK